MDVELIVLPSTEYELEFILKFGESSDLQLFRENFSDALAYEENSLTENNIKKYETISPMVDTIRCSSW